jgi:hypothetical protein
MNPDGTYKNPLFGLYRAMLPRGFSTNAAFSATRALANRTVESYDRAPTLWQTSNNARPFRVTAGWRSSPAT